MIILNNKITVDCFKIYKSKLYYLKGQRLFIDADCFVVNDIDSFTVVEERIFAYYKNTLNTFIYDLKMSKIEELEYTIIPSVDNDIRENKNGTILAITYESDSEFWVLYNINVNRKLFKYEISLENRSLALVYDDLFIEKSKAFIRLKKLSNNQVLWQYNYQDLLNGKEIMQFGNIHLINDAIYFYLSDNGDSKNYATYKIDIHTGKILNVYEQFGGNLLLANNKIYTTANGTIKYLDIETDIIEKIDLSKELKEKDLQIHWNSSIVYNNLLFFIDGHWATTNKFGIIDMKKNQLIYDGELEINDGINNNIQKVVYDSEKLYFHCSDDSLHIYEIR